MSEPMDCDIMQDGCLKRTAELFGMKSDKLFWYSLGHLGLTEKDPEGQRLYDIAVGTAKYYKNLKAEQAVPIWQPLEERWYKSLESGTPWYEVYGMREFVVESWACFVTYSRRYLMSLSKIREKLGTVKTVTDLGCGIGLTTAYLKSLFPEAAVVGTNLKGDQFDVATKTGLDCGFSVVEAETRKGVDLLFASEYFEHFRSPIEHLGELLGSGDERPRVVMTANSFSLRSIGHFPSYLINGAEVGYKKAQRQFNIAMRASGYTEVETGFWNGRPAVWSREATVVRQPVKREPVLKTPVL
jgi:hypothetical protein